MRLLTEGSAADLTHKWLLARVDLEVLLEVEPFRVDEKAANRAALVVRPAEKCEFQWESSGLHSVQYSELFLSNGRDFGIPDYRPDSFLSVSQQLRLPVRLTSGRSCGC